MSKSSEDHQWSKEDIQSENIDVQHYEDTMITEHPNAWAKFREPLRPYFAEFLGTAILLFFGAGVDCAAVLTMTEEVTGLARGTWLSINFGWAAGVGMGVWVSGGISGGHINPAVTLALAVFRGFPWKKVPGYFLAQTLGALVGAACVYANYHQAISIVEGGPHVRTQATASLFTTYSVDYISNVGAFFEEYLGSAVMMIVILAMSDKRNEAPPHGLAPLVALLLILGIGISWGYQTGYALNPARDLGPRMFLAMVGYGKQLFTFRHGYFVWCPIMAPFLGALSGALVYDGLIYVGAESPLNKPNAAARRRALEAPRSQRQPAPAGTGADRMV